MSRQFLQCVIVHDGQIVQVNMAVRMHHGGVPRRRIMWLIELGCHACGLMRRRHPRHPGPGQAPNDCRVLWGHPGACAGVVLQSVLHDLCSTQREQGSCSGSGMLAAHTVLPVLFPKCGSRICASWLFTTKHTWPPSMLPCTCPRLGCRPCQCVLPCTHSSRHPMSSTT